MSGTAAARTAVPDDVLGGFTTLLGVLVGRGAAVRRHSYSMAMTYIVGSVFASLVPLFLGLALFNGAKPLP